MWRRTILTVMLVGACMVCFFMVPEASSQADAAKKKRGAFKPVASVHSLMEAQGYHFGQMKKQIGSSGESRFNVLKTEAEILAELANVNRYHEDKDDCVRWCDQERDLSLAVAKAAENKDAAKAKKLISQIGKDCCGACHEAQKKH